SPAQRLHLFPPRRQQRQAARSFRLSGPAESRNSRRQPFAKPGAKRRSRRRETRAAPPEESPPESRAPAPDRVRAFPFPTVRGAIVPFREPKPHERKARR